MRTASIAVAIALTTVAVALAAPTASAAPPVHVYEEDGAVCFYFSEQVPQCTPPFAIQKPSLPHAGACVPVAGGCVLTVFTTDDSVCFYPTTAPTFCVQVL